jgi:hypothetical protein
MSYGVMNRTYSLDALAQQPGSVAEFDSPTLALCKAGVAAHVQPAISSRAIRGIVG